MYQHNTSGLDIKLLWPVAQRVSRFKVTSPPQIIGPGIFSDIKHRMCAMHHGSFVYSLYVNLANSSGYKTALGSSKTTD